jgi:hypothetical protein
MKLSESEEVGDEIREKTADQIMEDLVSHGKEFVFALRCEARG